MTDTTWSERADDYTTCYHCGTPRDYHDGEDRCPPREPLAAPTVDCPHDDDPATCPPCRRAAGKSNALPDDHVYENDGQSRPFEATFYGRCFGCDLPVYPGQTIVKRGNGHAHESCAA